MYIVAKYFTDLQDNDHPYQVGDTFPREGLEVTEERLAELASTSNKRAEVLIKAVKDEAKPKAKPKAKGKASKK